MDDSINELERLKNELAYYKRQVDWHAGNALRDQYALAQLSYDNSQLMKSFQLIADLQRNFSAHSTPDSLYSLVLESMISLTETDRVVLFKSSGTVLKPHLWKGFSKEEYDKWVDKELEDPFDYYTERKSLLLNSKTEPSSFERELQAIFRTPHFILTPLVKENQVWGALFTARMHEQKMMSYKPYTKSSVNTLEAIAGMISAFTLQIERSEQMERERSRIARDMHDDVGAELSRISIACENVKKQNAFNPQLNNDLSQIQNSTAQLISNIGNIIWALNPTNNNTLSLVGYLREFANNYLEMYHISLSFEAPELPMDHNVKHEVRTHLFMVMKESLHNVIKHSAATKVSIKISIDMGLFSCSISDNGKGFEMEQSRTFGNGLRNLRERMTEIGGTFRISSHPQEGTLIQFITSL